MEEEINYNQLKGRIERDEDWREGMNAFRSWVSKEIEDLRKTVKELKMKQQNEHAKTKHYRAYNESMPTQNRMLKAIEEASQGCWWIEAYLRGVYFARNTKTKTLIEGLEEDIKDALETVKLLRKTKRALEMRAFMLKHEPPKDAIKNACIRLGLYPKLTKNSELQDNGIKTSTKQDTEIDSIYQACSASSNDNSG